MISLVFSSATTLGRLTVTRGQSDAVLINCGALGMTIRLSEPDAARLRDDLTALTLTPQETPA